MTCIMPSARLAAGQQQHSFHPCQRGSRRAHGTRGQHHRQRPIQASAAASDVPSGDGVPAPAPKSFLQKVKEYFLGSKEEKNKLASLGMGAFASYSVISNVTYSICLTIAWVTFVKATGLSPLAEGQWKPFLAFYAGLWTIQNFVRPMRFALAVALAPKFDALIGWIGARLGGIPRPAAFGVFLFCQAIVTTTSLFTALVVCGGFPDGIPFFTQAKSA